MIHLVTATQCGKLASIEAFEEYTDALEYLYALMRGAVRATQLAVVNGQDNQETEKLYQEMMRTNPQMARYKLLSVEVQKGTTK